MEAQNFALVTRAAKFTWEALTPLLATQQETAPVTITFPQAVNILSVYPSVSDLGGQLDVPTLDDLLVRIDVDNGAEQRLTSRFDTQQPGGGAPFPNVTLGSYRDTVMGSRVLNFDFGELGSRPTLTVTFAWKRPIANGPHWNDVLVGLAFNCNFAGSRA